MLKPLLTAAILAGSTLAYSDDLQGKSWDDIVAQAKQEGELTWYVWHLKDDLRRFVQPFEQEYGIKVIIPEGTLAGNHDKLLAERNRERSDIDVFANGFLDYENLDPNKFFISLDVLPKDDGRISSLFNVGFDNHVVAYWGNQSGIAYDPAKISGDALPQTPQDFAAFWQANPGKFGFNYENGGSGPSFIENVSRHVGPLDAKLDTLDGQDEALKNVYAYFNNDAQDYVITTGNADSLTRISDGELWLAPAWEDHLAGLQKRGEVRKDLAFYIPSMGMNGGANGVAIPVNAPHPAAAAVFINWLTSADTQSRLNAEFGTVPMNSNADDSQALVSKEERQYQVQGMSKAVREQLLIDFTDYVILER